MDEAVKRPAQQTGDSTGTTSYTYTNRGELASVSYPNGRTVTYTYGKVQGRRTKMNLSGYRDTTYLHDSGGRLLSVTTPYAESTAYQYDQNNLVVKLTGANQAFTDYSYNYQRNWLTQVVNRKSNLGVISQFGYTTDAAGNRLRGR